MAQERVREGERCLQGSRVIELFWAVQGGLEWGLRCSLLA
jgi:hypothetical protein